MSEVIRDGRSPDQVRGDQWVEALLVERAGYLRAGKTARADQVTAQLRAAGYTEPRAVAAPEARGRRTAKG